MDAERIAEVQRLLRQASAVMPTSAEKTDVLAALALLDEEQPAKRPPCWMVMKTSGGPNGHNIVADRDNGGVDVHLVSRALADLLVALRPFFEEQTRFTNEPFAEPARKVIALLDSVGVCDG